MAGHADLAHLAALTESSQPLSYDLVIITTHVPAEQAAGLVAQTVRAMFEEPAT